MNAFQTVIQKYYGQNKIFKINEDDNMEFIQYISVNKYNQKTTVSFYVYFYFMQIFARDGHEFIIKKFLALNKFLTNMFTSQHYAEEMLTEFSKIQKIFFVFRKHNII
jgi:hypothetical protein